MPLCRTPGFCAWLLSHRIVARPCPSLAENESIPRHPWHANHSPLGLDWTGCDPFRVRPRSNGAADAPRYLQQR